MREPSARASRSSVSLLSSFSVPSCPATSATTGASIEGVMVRLKVKVLESTPPLLRDLAIAKARQARSSGAKFQS